MQVAIADCRLYLHTFGVARPPKQSQVDLPVVSLFSGPGGLDLGFHRAGFRTILAADFSARAVETYNHNLPPVAHKLDLATVSPDEIVRLIRISGSSPRGVIGGPPCQSFSQANVRQRKDDPRNRLIFRFAEIVKKIDEAFAIDFFLMENVAALAKPKHRKSLDSLKAKFERAGFIVHEEVKNAHDFDVAQRRPRLFLIGIKRELAGFARFQFPEGEATDKTVRTEIGDLPEPVFFERKNPSKRIPFHANHWTMQPLSMKFAAGTTATGRSFRKLQWNAESPAVAYGHREIHVHPTGTRRLSLLEALLLQGFPRRYELRGNLSEQVTQVSNAVPPPLAKAMALAIRAALYDRRRSAQLSLLGHQTRHGRDFPWRNTTNNFHLLVAEKLLQQTAAGDVVVVAYRAILRKWPTARQLANASVADVYQIVQPLGFSYRAQELISLASAIHTGHNGDVPLDRSALMRLPGVGEYAADAVLSFSGHTTTAVVDTNVSRLLHRLLGLSNQPPLNPSRSQPLKRLATWLSDGQPSRSMNYAVLDFTSSVCVARSPECRSCPLRHLCVGKEDVGLAGAIKLEPERASGIAASKPTKRAAHRRRLPLATHPDASLS